MNSYTISKVADNNKFREACDVIEKTIKHLNKSDILIDVDGSLLQKYSSQNASIKVYNDYDVDAVYVDSDISIPEFKDYKI